MRFETDEQRTVQVRLLHQAKEKARDAKSRAFLVGHEGFEPHWSGYEPPALTVKLMALMTLFQRSVKWLSYPENTQVRFLSH